jgi:hypothetical protein
MGGAEAILRKRQLCMVLEGVKCPQRPFFFLFISFLSILSLPYPINPPHETSASLPRMRRASPTRTGSPPRTGSSFAHRTGLRSLPVSASALASSPGLTTPRAGFLVRPRTLPRRPGGSSPCQPPRLLARPRLFPRRPEVSPTSPEQQPVRPPTLIAGAASSRCRPPAPPLTAGKKGIQVQSSPGPTRASPGAG